MEQLIAMWKMAGSPLVPIRPGVDIVDFERWARNHTPPATVDTYAHAIVGFIHELGIADPPDRDVEPEPAGMGFKPPEPERVQQQEAEPPAGPDDAAVVESSEEIETTETEEMDERSGDMETDEAGHEPEIQEHDDEEPPKAKTDESDTVDSDADPVPDEVPQDQGRLF